MAGVEVDETVAVDPVAMRFADGGDAALREAYDAHAGLVYSYCRRAVGDERAKDVTQEVFVSAWKARERFDPLRGSLGAWLMGIAKNRLVDEIRSERRHESRRDEAARPIAGGDDELDRMGDKMLVAEALGQLPDRSRHVIELAYFHGLTHAEIAERTNLPLGTVKSDVRRSLIRIRRHLETHHD